MLIVAAVVVYGVFGADVFRWGCPSQEELERLRDPDEVVAAFAEGGLPVVQVEWPAELRRARAYRGSVVFRHEARGATLSLVVCRAHCELPRSQLRPGRARRLDRFGFSNRNAGVAGWISSADPRAAARMRRQLEPAFDALGTNVDPGSRCYIG